LRRPDGRLEIDMITGFLHPGEMGASMAAACAGRRIWASERRSPATAARATAAGIDDVGDVATLVEMADTIVSVCPPDAALAQARAVSALGFSGIYVDANATSPATARLVASLFEHAVDGGIVGPPAHQPRTTRLYLSGSNAADVARRWQGSMLEARVIGDDPGTASALKMCYAAWTKGSAALLLAIVAVATAEGVDVDLAGEWHISQPDLPTRAARAAQGSTPKAWRFAGEMDEIAATFRDAGLPSGFHEAAAEVFRRLAVLKDAPAPSLEDVIDTLIIDPAARGGREQVDGQTKSTVITPKSA
jgi:3-hydroxyisobutyrate dehydrogenase-like beta-hydroxyacid dehydrogenase